MQASTDALSPRLNAVPVPTYVEVLQHTITTHDRSVSPPGCFVSRLAVEGSADEMLVMLAVHQWIRNQGQLQPDGSILAHISRFGQMVYHVTVVKNNLLVQNHAGKKVLAAGYVPNVKTMRVMHCSLSDDDVMQFSGLMTGLLASTARKRRQWRSRTQTPGFTNARYAVRR
jgi:hypothetical protein